MAAVELAADDDNDIKFDRDVTINDDGFLVVAVIKF